MVCELQEYFNGAFLKENVIYYRQYQDNIVQKCQGKNSLVVLPTGLGKTIVGILLAADALNKYKNHGKILILAPTRPLVAQHEQSCAEFLDVEEEKIVRLTGKISPEKRIALFQQSRVIISTPQVIKNDVERGRYDLKHVSLIIFDEAHRTKGKYAFNFLSHEYISQCSDPLILGLTASPGKNQEKIQELCDNLFIENVVFKTYEDEDVIEYIHDIEVFIEHVDLKIGAYELSQIWYNLFKKYLRFFIEHGLLPPNKPYYSKMDFLGISHDLNLSLQYERDCEAGFVVEEEYLEQLYFQFPRVIDIVKEKAVSIPTLFSYCSSCISILHAKDLLETQDISLFSSFLNKIENKADHGILSAKRIVNSKHFKHIKSVINEKKQENLSHPKLDKVVSIIKEEMEVFENNRFIIFTQYRQMAQYLKDFLAEQFQGTLAIEKFIGQSSKEGDLGFSQGKQIDIIQQFREGKIDILIATSVAEEGLDIPNVDAILFYEPIPSEIRMIQRRGRTGRFSSGRCYILMTEDTVDVPFHIVARKKEEAMNDVLQTEGEISLTSDIKRKKITFSDLLQSFSEYDYVKNFYERKEQERDLLAERSVEDIISELDSFTKSKEYKKLKECGVTFYSDLAQLDKHSLKQKIKKIKHKPKKRTSDRKKHRISKKMRTLIDFVKYSEHGALNKSEFENMVKMEEIPDHLYQKYYNQACYKGYLEERDDSVYFLSDYE